MQISIHLLYFQKIINLKSVFAGRLPPVNVISKLPPFTWYSNILATITPDGKLWMMVYDGACFCFEGRQDLDVLMLQLCLSP